MNFDDIDVNNLKNAIQSCRNAINYSISSSLVDEIMDGNVWFCSTRNNLKNAFSCLTNVYYKELEDMLVQYSAVADLIQEYQEKTGQNQNLQNENNSLRNRLYYEEEYQDSVYNSETEEWDYETKTRTVKDIQVEKQMLENSTTIDSNTIRITTIENTVCNMIG